MESKDWAYAPRNVLHLILDKLFPFCEYVRLACVCKPWLSTASENFRHLQQRYGLHEQLPVLMVPTEDKDRHTKNVYSLVIDKLCNFQLTMPSLKKVTGCSQGWIATWNEDKIVTLFHPIKKKTIYLPKLKELYTDYVSRVMVYRCGKKVILSPADSSLPIDASNFVVAAIHGPLNSLAYIKSGDDDWTYVSSDGNSDIIFHKGHLLAVHLETMIISVDLYSDCVSSPEVKYIVGQIRLVPPFWDFQPYLAESSTGDVLLFLRFSNGSVTKEFRVFRLTVDPTTGGGDKWRMYREGARDEDWDELHSLDGVVVFLGDNYSTCVKTSDIPGCRQNSIYFTHDYTCRQMQNDEDLLLDMAVFRIDDSCIIYHYKRDPPRIQLPVVLPFMCWLTLPKFSGSFYVNQ